LLFPGLSGPAPCASWTGYFRALQIGYASKVTPLDRSRGGFCFRIPR